MQPNPYASYPYPNGQPMPVRYMVPPGYRQNSPQFANQPYDHYAPAPPSVHLPQHMTQPLRYPPGYRPGYAPPGSNMMPIGSGPRPLTPQQQQEQQQRRQSEQLQPPRPYYYNPYGPNGGNPEALPGPKPPAPKKGAKEYKDNAFTIAPDGAQSESIKGLVSNNDINDLLKHKGTKVRVSKIYRITKSKPDIVVDDSSDDDLPLPTQSSRQQPSRQQPSQTSRRQPSQTSQSQPVQRPVSSSSSGSHCSTCSNCSCTDCRDKKQAHGYDDCPDCRAERKREQAKQQRHK